MSYSSVKDLDIRRVFRPADHAARELPTAPNTTSTRRRRAGWEADLAVSTGASPSGRGHKSARRDQCTRRTLRGEAGLQVGLQKRASSSAGRLLDAAGSEVDVSQAESPPNAMLNHSTASRWPAGRAGSTGRDKRPVPCAVVAAERRHDLGQRHHGARSRRIHVLLPPWHEWLDPANNDLDNS